MQIINRWLILLYAYSLRSGKPLQVVFVIFKHDGDTITRVLTVFDQFGRELCQKTPIVTKFDERALMIKLLLNIFKTALGLARLNEWGNFGNTLFQVKIN